MKQWPRHHGPRLSRSLPNLRRSRARTFSAAKPLLHESSHDPRIRDLGRQILDDYAMIRENYGTFPPSPSSPFYFFAQSLRIVVKRIESDQKANGAY